MNIRVLEKLRWKWICFRCGVKNLYYFAPAVWNFDDCDHSGLTRLLIAAITKMRDSHKFHSPCEGAQDTAKELDALAQCLQRLYDEEYVKAAGYKGRGTMTREIADRAEDAHQKDVEFLSKSFLKIRHWWH